MQVLECDAKKLLSRHAIASPSGIVAATPEEAEAAATHLGREPVFVKAQVGAGDRMSAGGIRAAHSAAEAKVAARALLGRKLVTSQTSPDGRVVAKVLVGAEDLGETRVLPGREHRPFFRDCHDHGRRQRKGRCQAESGETIGGTRTPAHAHQR